MGIHIKVILIIVAILAVVGAAGIWLRYGTQDFDETARQVSEEEQRDSTAAVPPAEYKPDEESAVPPGAATPPRFDIVRVEPTGDLVAAGRAASKAHVMLLHGDEELESADANSIGEWAIVLDQPLAPGTYDLLLRATGPDGSGDPVDGDRVTVVVEGPDTTPFVALMRPGEPAEILQQPEGKTVVSALEPPSAAAPRQPSASASDAAPPTSAAEQPVVPATGESLAKQAGSGETAPAQPDTPQQQAVAAQDPAPAAGGPSGAQIPEGQSAQPMTGQTETARVPAATSPAVPATGEPPADQAGSGETAPAQPEAAQQQAVAAQDPAPAASGPSGAQTPEGQSAQPMTGQTETAQAPAGTSPAVPPAGAPSVAGPDSAPASPQVEPSAPAASAGTPAALPQDMDAGDEPAQQTGAEPAGNVSIETVEVEDADRLMLSGEAEPGDAVRLYLNNEQLADVETDAEGRWTLSSDRPMPPGRYELRADVLSGTGNVKGRAEVKFDRVEIVSEDGQAAAASTGDQSGDPAARPGSTVTIVSHGSGAGAASPGAAVGEGAGTSVVVIARGDSLWRIARKIYGRGVRHSVIFEANKNQIRDPNLIYPGQVFTIPVVEGENE